MSSPFPTWRFWNAAWRGWIRRLKGAKAQERDRINRESAVLQKINRRLLEEIPVREQELTDDEKKQTSALQLLTAKPLLVLLNIGEDQLSGVSRLEADLEQKVNRPNVSCVALCGRLEEELSQMDEEEEAEFRKSLNAGEARRRQGCSGIVPSSWPCLFLDRQLQ